MEKERINVIRESLNQIEIILKNVNPKELIDEFNGAYSPEFTALCDAQLALPKILEAIRYDEENITAPKITDDTKESTHNRIIDSLKNAEDPSPETLSGFSQHPDEGPEVDQETLHHPTLSSLPKMSQTNGNSQMRSKKSIQLMNATCDQTYSAELNQYGINHVTEVSLGGNKYGISAIGLEYIHESNSIVGTPNNAGNFEIIVYHQIGDGERAPIIQETILQLAIIANPQSLWQENEPDASLEYPKPHFDYLAMDCGNHRILAASIRGRSHAHNGTFRDDHFAVTSVKTKSGLSTWLLAVADGAGSCMYSREGSRLACESAKSLFENSTAELTSLQEAALEVFSSQIRSEDSSERFKDQAYGFVGKLVLNSRRSIESEAKRRETSTREFSTTLLFSLAVEIRANEYVLITYGIGDGAIALVTDENVSLLTKPDGGAFAGQTRFLTMEEAISEINDRIFVLHPVKTLSGLFLATDGVTDPYFGTDKNLQERDLWQTLKEDCLKVEKVASEKTEESLKELMSFWSKGNHDDRTLIWVHPLE